MYIEWWDNNQQENQMALLNKITTGFVIQVFDTEKKEFVSQEFICGDQCDYEDANGEGVDASEFNNAAGAEAYLPFEMRQPAETGQDEYVTPATDKPA
jgi:hypothetical protein